MTWVLVRHSLSRENRDWSYALCRYYHIYSCALHPSIHATPRENTGVGCYFPPPGDLPDPGIELASTASPILAGGFFTIVPPVKPGSSVLTN